MNTTIPFNKPYMHPNAVRYMREAVERGHLSGDGAFTKKCHAWLEEKLECGRAFLTHSGTAALEMAAILADLKPGDEVILPSFAFSSTANAFVLRGAVPVFVDIRPDTLNIDESLIEAAVTPRTRAICVVHYGGVACDMDAIAAIARRHGLVLIEDAAHAILCGHRGKKLGSIGDLAALSFHETKTLSSGEGGALLVNDPRLVERAEIIREKGTNRSQFFRGETDKYTWRDVGSSFLPSDLIAAYLWSQLEAADAIIEARQKIWAAYHEAFARLEERGSVRRPVVPGYARHTAHLYHLLLPDPQSRTQFLAALKARGVSATFHYLPLHDSPAGRRFGRAAGPMTVTDSASQRLARLPLWMGVEDSLSRIIEAVHEAAAEIEAGRARPVTA